MHRNTCESRAFPSHSSDALPRTPLHLFSHTMGQILCRIPHAHSAHTESGVRVTPVPI